MVLPIRLGALALGLVCSCLGMFGAFEFAMKLEGDVVTYLVLAAPVIAGAAASIPVLAEATWRERAYLKASSGGPHWFLLEPWSFSLLLRGST